MGALRFCLFALAVVGFARAADAEQAELQRSLDDLKAAVAGKIDWDVERSAQAFWDAYDIEQSRRIAKGTKGTKGDASLFPIPKSQTAHPLWRLTEFRKLPEWFGAPYVPWLVHLIGSLDPQVVRRRFCDPDSRQRRWFGPLPPHRRRILSRRRIPR
jgi:hypothetical protein